MSARRSLAALVVAVVPFAAACGAGKNNETQKEHTTPFVANAAAGSVLVRGVQVVIAAGATFGSPSPSPTASTSASPTASPTATATAVQAYIVVTFVNTGNKPDLLTNVTAGAGAVSPTSATPDALTVQPGRTLGFVDPDLGTSGSSLIVSGLSSPLRVGTSVPVSFTFRDAGTVHVQAPVRDVATAGTTDTASPVQFTGNYPSASVEVPVHSSPKSFEPTSSP